ncbi:hypothetical protein HK098_000200 [Nowakowskiella sp. JEL0407]|nr:hypothetical protein HK098_000200 [Nowakowskiella sp. JEL0407]
MSYDQPQQRRGGNRARAPPMSMRAPPPNQNGYQNQPPQDNYNNRAPSMMPQQQWVDPRYSHYNSPQQNYSQPPPREYQGGGYVSPQQPQQPPNRYQGQNQQYPPQRGNHSPTNNKPGVWSDSASDSSVNMEDRPGQQYKNQGQAYQPYNPATGPRQPPQQQAYRKPTEKSEDGKKVMPNVPSRSYALDGEDDKSKRTNRGNTKALMALIAEMWIFHIAIILGSTYWMVFYNPINFYTDTELWNASCYWKLVFLLPMPYTIVCLFGLALPFRTPKFLYHDKLKKRRCDNFYILTVTRGNNREAVYRAWNAHKHLERLHPSVRVHVLTDEPFFFENINCYTCPKAFSTAKSKYKARALEWYRQTMRYTEYDWIMHLDEESVIDDETVRRCLEFIWYEEDCHWGQGVILYNQYKFWSNWIFTVADALRVGDDLSRFQLQYTYFKRPLFGAHGSFLMTNGLVENAITWDLGSLTEDYEFAVAAWKRGFRCGKVAGFIREQSPQGYMDFMKQRRRWFIGIWRLGAFLPKLWAFFWTLGLPCLAGTIASIPLGLIKATAQPTPRWLGLCKDLTFCVFVYLYILGMFIQDVDKGKFPLLVLLHIPLTFVVQFITVTMEALAVAYGLIFPPKGFDVIKK